MKIEKTLPNYIIQGVEYLEFSNLGLLCTLTYTYFEKVRLSCDSTYSICADYCMDTDDDTFSPCTFGKRIGRFGLCPSISYNSLLNPEHCLCKFVM